MKVTLLGFTVPDALYSEIADVDEAMPAQTHRFAWSLVDALQSAGAEVRLISAAPVSSYPNNPRVLWRGGRWRARQVPGLTLPFINLPILKHLTRFASCWLLAARELKLTQPDWLLVHGVHSPFLWFAGLYGGRSSTAVAAILTDPPGMVRSTDNFVTALLRRVDIFLVRSALSRFDAVISLTEALAADFAPSLEAMVMEGICAGGGKTAIAESVTSPLPPSVRPRVIYAGGIQREYGVVALIEAVANSDLDVELRIFGRGPDENLVREAALTDQRIVGPGLLHPDDLEAWYRSAVALVQPRPIGQAFVPYSFPSKLIEYLATGTPVVSTRLPSIPGDYESLVVWAVPDSAEGLRGALTRVLAWDEAERRTFGASAATFIRATRSPQTQGQRILRFLHDSGAATGTKRT